MDFGSTDVINKTKLALQRTKIEQEQLVEKLIAEGASEQEIKSRLDTITSQSMWNIIREAQSFLGLAGLESSAMQTNPLEFLQRHMAHVSVDDPSQHQKALKKSSTLVN